jgi:aryl-alcohol dehydrogenase-like predicted oxidoreductase
VGVVKTAALGESGRAISRVGYGGWQASGSGPWSYGPRSDDADSLASIRRAVELGVTWVDTAASYGLGHSEEIVSRALEPWSVGEDVLVFTKCGHPWEPRDRIRTDLSPASIRAECEGSLRRLGVERIDLYQFHHVDPRTPVEASWATMAELVEEGKVRWAGVSNFDVDLLDRCEEIRHVDCVQPELSLLRRGALREVIPWCRGNGTGIIVYSPMATGALGGADLEATLEALPADDWRHRSSEGILEAVDRLRGVADRIGASVPLLSVAWTLAQEGVTGAICGARRPDQVDGWIGAADLVFPPGVVAEIESIADPERVGSEP